MNQIESFCIDHEKLMPGLYVSRRDNLGGEVTTFDIRLLRPNKSNVFDTGAMHTIEHIGATYLRNTIRRDEIIYFGPMGCRTGFYLVMFGQLFPFDVLRLVKDMFSFIRDYTGEIPGATPKECGNYSDQNLTGAKKAAESFVKLIEKGIETEYPR